MVRVRISGSSDLYCRRHKRHRGDFRNVSNTAYLYTSKTTKETHKGLPKCQQNGSYLQGEVKRETINITSSSTVNRTTTSRSDEADTTDFGKVGDTTYIFKLKWKRIQQWCLEFGKVKMKTAVVSETPAIMSVMITITFNFWCPSEITTVRLTTSSVIPAMNHCRNYTPI